MGSMHEYMELAFLGTGGSWPTVHRNVSALALKRGSEVLLMDCGEGTQRQFQRSELSYMGVSTVLLTHLHGDHILGLPGLMQTMDLNDRSDPLLVAGPPGTKRYVSLLMSRPMPTPSYDVEVLELEDGDVIGFDGYRVEARELDHTATALGYAIVEDPRPGRFDKQAALDLGVPEGPMFGRLQQGEPVELDDGTVVEPEQVLDPPRRGRKVAYTGDCRPSEVTAELAEGADVLVHEATFADDREDANEMGHSTARQAAFLAQQAGVRELFLTHISPRYADPSPLVEQAREVFEDARVAEDLDSYTVTFPPDEPAEGPFARTADEAATVRP